MILQGLQFATLEDIKMETRSLIRNVDQFLFDKIPSIRSFTPYQLFQDFLANLADEKKNLVKYAISFVLVLLPIFVTAIFWFQNMSLKSELQTKKDIYYQANRIIQEEKLFGQTGKSLIMPNAAHDENTFSSNLNNFLGRFRIDSDKVKIQDFTPTDLGGNIQQNTVTLIFNDFTTSQFTTFISDLSLRQKVKVGSIEIVRNESKNLIEGKISIIYLSEVPKS